MIRIGAGARIVAVGTILLATTGAAPGGTVALAGPARADTLALAAAQARRQGLRAVAVASSQSFRITDAGREVATLVTGEGTPPGVRYAGCFVAIVRGARVKLIPTIGHGDYEAETCGGPSAVGLLSSGDPVRFGVVFDASSPNARLREPLVVAWHRATDMLTIDAERSTRASLAGAQSIAAMRRALR